jgi:hypothetical protein
MDNHALRREHVINEAIRAGKFSESRRAFWTAEYDRNPARTEQTLASLASGLDGEPPYPRELFPELSRRHSPHTRRTAVAASAPPPPPPAAEIVDEEVARWSRELFPETVAAGAGRQRIVHCND